MAPSRSSSVATTTRMTTTRATTLAFAVIGCILLASALPTSEAGTWLRATHDALSSVEVIDESHSDWPPDKELQKDAMALHSLDVSVLKALFAEFPRARTGVYPDKMRSWEDIGVASGFDNRDLADAADDEESGDEDDVEVGDGDGGETLNTETSKSVYFSRQATVAELQPVLDKHGGSIESALRIINDRLKIDPDNPFLLVDLGNTHRLLGENKQSLEYFNKASRFLQHADLYQLRGATLMALGRIEEASKVFGQGVDYFPRDATLRLSLGLAYSELENWREAIKMLKSVLRLRPGFSFAAEQLAYASMMAQMKSSVLLETVIFVMFALVCAVVTVIWWKYARHKKGRHFGHKKRK
jgi:tetratricopeptide (TPR) repeat protein